MLLFVEHLTHDDAIFMVQYLEFCMSMPQSHHIQPTTTLNDKYLNNNNSM